MGSLEAAVQAVAHGGVIAYPTEAVFGLGCDPQSDMAVQRILSLKQRSPVKGLILVATSFDQLIDYVDLQGIDLEPILATWPGPNTWIFPLGKATSSWISGDFDSVAVRVSRHPVVQQLCLALGHPLVSTSANPQSLPSALSAKEVRAYFFDTLDVIVDLPLGLESQPSCIRDARTLKVVRA